MCETYKMLLISTAHITQETFNRLNDGDVFMPSWGNRYGYGAIMCVYPNWEDNDDDIPSDLIACMKFADKLHCDYIRFDGDGFVVSELPTYDW